MNMNWHFHVSEVQASPGNPVSVNRTFRNEKDKVTKYFAIAVFKQSK